ncbi:MAG: ATP-binding cassette domain-containing protein, partial [Cryobacterium sp.]|nr:ATP-binding cassette domain-containing protein [Oligoflexia bacterium]
MNILNVHSVGKGFRQGDVQVRILENLDLQVEQGETVAILGKSGSGKSTLLSLLAGLDSPDTGSVELEGEDLGKITEKRLLQLRNEKIGIVFQQFHLFPEL